MTMGSGGQILEDEKHLRKVRMIESLKQELMRRSDITQEARDEAIARIKRWEREIHG